MQKILVISHYADQLISFRGELIKGMVDKGYKVKAIAPETGYKEALNKLGAEYESISLDRTGMNPIKDLKTIYELYKIIKDYNPDILHTQLFHANIAGRIIGKLAGVPYIISSIRNNKFKNNLRYKAMALTDKLTDVTTVVSGNAADDMINAGALSEERAKVLYNGLDVEEFLSSINTDNLEDELKLEKEVPTIISVGSLTEQKGYDVLMSALNILDDKGYNFNYIIAGEGNKRDFIESKIAEYDLSNKVKLLGRRDDVSSLLSISDIFVLSSKWEGLPGVVIEAMAEGLPVIATNVGGVNEIIDDGKDGFIVQPNDPEAIANKIIDVLNLSEKEKDLLSENARNKINNKFHVDIMVKNYEELYDSFK